MTDVLIEQHSFKKKKGKPGNKKGHWIGMLPTNRLYKKYFKKLRKRIFKRGISLFFLKE